jgi:hypothetical protein
MKKPSQKFVSSLYIVIDNWIYLSAKKYPINKSIGMVVL